MTEVRQDIFPVCSFGRAENIYFQSEGSLCSKDLGFDEILQLIKDVKQPIFPSHVLDRDDWLGLLKAILEKGFNPRVQISLGREWEEVGDKVMTAVALGWGLDILVDRPLGKLPVPKKLDEIQNLRWVGCPLRFFDIKELMLSLLRFEPRREVALCFLEPRDKNSLLLNADEVVLLKQKLLTIYKQDILGSFFLILTPKFKREENFYDSLSLQDYQEHFVELGDYKKMRTTVSKSLKNYPRFISMIIYICAIFFSKAQRAQQIEVLYWKLISAYRRTRWFVGQIGWKIYSLFKYLILLLVKLGWQLKSFAGLIKVGCVHCYWAVRRYSYILYRVIFWPVHKIYWILEYQYFKRIHPYVKGLFSND